MRFQHERGWEGKKKKGSGDRHKIPKSCPITERKTAAERGERGAKKGTKGFHFHWVFVEKEMKRQTGKSRKKSGESEKKNPQ